MSKENIESMRRGIAAYNARDIDGLLGICAPDIRFRSALAAADGAFYDGHEGMRTWTHEVAETWSDKTWIEPETYFDLGERTLAFYLWHGRGLTSQVQVALPVALLAVWAGGVITELTAYADRSKALAELGVSVGDLTALPAASWEGRRPHL